jgi:cytochrome c5
VSAAHDRKFFDTFLLVIAILVGIALALVVVARIIAANTSGARRQTDPMYEKQVEARITPFARDAVAGQDNASLNPPAAAVPAVTADLTGNEVFDQVCTACHGAGVAGAPKYGDKAAWAPRIAQGMDTLHQHALQGFQGKSGFMPPKGGRTDLSDKSIENGVDYMVAGSK